MHLKLTDWFPAPSDVQRKGERTEHIKKTPHYRWRVLDDGALYLDNKRGRSQSLVTALSAMTSILQTASAVNPEELKKLRTYVDLKVQRYEEVHGWLYKFLFARRLEEVKKAFHQAVEDKLKIEDSPPVPPPSSEDSSAETVEEEKASASEESSSPASESSEAVEEEGASLELMEASLQGEPEPIKWPAVLGDVEVTKKVLMEHCTVPSYFSDGFQLWSTLVRDTTSKALSENFTVFVAQYIKQDVRSCVELREAVGAIIQSRQDIYVWHKEHAPHIVRPITDISLHEKDPFQLNTWNDMFFTLLSMLAGQISRYGENPIFSEEYVSFFKEARVDILVKAFYRQKASLYPAEDKLLGWLRLVDQQIFSVVDSKEGPEESMRLVKEQLEADRQFVEGLNATWLNTAVNALRVPFGETILKEIVKRVLPPAPDIEKEERMRLERSLEVQIKQVTLADALKFSPSFEESLRLVTEYSADWGDYWARHRETMPQEEIIDLLQQYMQNRKTTIDYLTKLLASTEFQQVRAGVKVFYNAVWIPILHATIDQHQIYYLAYAMTHYRDAITARANWYAMRLKVHAKEIEALKAYERACETRDDKLREKKRQEYQTVVDAGKKAIGEKEVLYRQARRQFYPIFLQAAKTLYTELEENPLVQRFFQEFDQQLRTYELPDGSYDFSKDLFNRVLFPVLERILKIPDLFPRG